ncbi:hypothetical protein SLEP1_g18873 [Rubroshorea leprosula]|uniref:NADH dehydrogenase subunit 1 n=1 Tax=Rubroshorea leprosula TaxID=152421 RepID=A0AAV5J7X2_9ROSI|nr:hypothetical protein SLEP1_g18873 [Rubroshorea leprosula]
MDLKIVIVIVILSMTFESYMFTLMKMLLMPKQMN